MENPGDQDLRKIEDHEWHLWTLALGLLLVLGGLTAGTFLFLLSDLNQDPYKIPGFVRQGVAGFSALILLFCIYVVHTRMSLRKMREVLWKQTPYDDLTHLYNRRHFNVLIREEIIRAEQSKHSIAMFLYDLDHFSAINGQCGFQVGDELLQAVAKKIRRLVRGTDLVFRWGGDEFMVLCTLDMNIDEIMKIAERIRRGIQDTFRKRQLEMDASTGIAIYPDLGKTPDELVGIVDRSLFIAKKSGDKIHVGDEEYHLNDQSIRIVFQPIIDVWSDQVLGYESLGRDPQGKLPILDLFKKYRAIGRLNELKRICFQTQLDLAQEVGLERIFVNVDFQMLSHLELTPRPEGMEVILEISEAEALEDIDNHLEMVTRWRELGYQFAIDDFGAGFISLPFIAKLTPEYIKLDRATILHAVASRQFKGFLKRLIPALRMYSVEGIIAEGIETEEELQVAKDLGIFNIQGFLLGRPKELKKRLGVSSQLSTTPTATLLQ